MHLHIFNRLSLLLARTHLAMLLRPPPLVSSLTFLLAFLIPLAGAVKFELIAEHHPKPSESACTSVPDAYVVRSLSTKLTPRRMVS